MSEGQKPFACTVEGCAMTFTNEDHLNWHRKKHDMVLNIGLANSSAEVADQTPTPTRFIRNCEEVGLFQDLQNVNPFDDFFKKAIEITKSGGTLEVHEINPDETLHTPHILPHIEDCQNKTTQNGNDTDSSHSTDFALNNVIQIASCHDEVSKGIIESNIQIHEDCRRVINSNHPIKISDKDEERKSVKLKIKQTLQDRGNQTTSRSNVIDLTKEPKKHITGLTTLYSPVCKEETRAMNRAAQVRCRKRKAQKWKDMEEEIKKLKNDNRKLIMENVCLVNQLIIKNNKCSCKKIDTTNVEGIYN